MVNGRLRRTYRVTALGAETVAAEVDRMTALATKARARLVAGVAMPATGGAR